jgi:hypothetical protein
MMAIANPVVSIDRYRLTARQVVSTYCERKEAMWFQLQEKGWGYEQAAGPSTAPLAIKLREASLRMTLSGKSTIFGSPIVHAA